MTGEFLKVKCPKCKYDEQVIYGKCSCDVCCIICGQVLAKSTGGKAEFKCKILEVHSGKEKR